MRIREILDDPDCAVGAVARLIQADPLLAARTVALANRLVEIESPFARSPEEDTQRVCATIDLAVENETLLDILQEAAGEVDALAEILRR